MVEFEILTLAKYNVFVDKISLMNTMVFEELYRSYYDLDLEQAPYDYYHADNVISPRDTKNHDEYFGKVKPLAVDLFQKWYDRLTESYIVDEGDKKTLSVIGHNIENAKDMVDLVWYSQLLLKAVYRYLEYLRTTNIPKVS